LAEILHYETYQGPTGLAHVKVGTGSRISPPRSLVSNSGFGLGASAVCGMVEVCFLQNSRMVDSGHLKALNCCLYNSADIEVCVSRISGEESRHV